MMIMRAIIGVVVGGLMGYALYRFVGCSSGTCPITYNPWVSTIFGMVVGGLTSGGFGKLTPRGFRGYVHAGPVGPEERKEQHEDADDNLP
jgi:high-affinity Fe2+/Pb2+ permease